MKPSKANLECADVILNRNNLPPHAWPDLRRDIALAIGLAEREAAKKLRRFTGKNEKSELKRDGIRAVTSQSVERETLKNMRRRLTS